MPVKDAERWNARYLELRGTAYEHPRPFLVEHADLLPRKGLALDVAMGMGGNASFLLERGLRVIGVDISAVALRQAKTRLPALMAVIADLDAFYLPTKTFDLIVNFYYLDRELFPAYKRALRPGGLLLFETLTVRWLDYQPEIDPAYLLQPGELRLAFADLEILVYNEGVRIGETAHPRPVASLIAQSPLT